MTAQLVVTSTSTPEAGAEVRHLRRLIEKQPVCILRVGTDGLLLAVNDSAVGLLGADVPAQVLGTKLTERISQAQRQLWDEFAARIGEGTSTSIECDLTDRSGGQRTVLLQGVPLLDHADGVPSMILSIRDTSTHRLLETALRDREVSQELRDLKAQLDGQAFAGRPRSGASQDERHSNNQRAVADRTAEWARREQTLTEEHQLALLAKEREGRQLLDNLRAELDRALTEHLRLVALVEEHQLALRVKERESRQLLDELRGDVDQAVEEKQRLATLLDEREADHQRILAEWTAEEAGLKQRVAEEHQLALLLKERESRELLNAMRTELEEARAEQTRLARSLDEREQNYQSTIGDAEAGRHQAEQSLAAALLRQTELEKAIADQRVELRSLDENARSLEWLAVAGRSALEIGRELETVVEAVGARTQHLLGQSSTEAADRHVIEALRDDAISAASLTRQLAQAAAAASMSIRSGKEA